MDQGIPADLDFSVEQPVSSDIAMYGGVFAKLHIIPKTGTYVPQHSHEYDHLSLLVAGRMRAWCDGALLGDYAAPAAIRIPAHTKHTFMSLTDGAAFFCIHNSDRFEVADRAGFASEPVDLGWGEPDEQGICIQQEPLAALKRDGAAIMIEHLRMVGEGPEMLEKKNWPLMLKMSEMGVLHCTTARCNGRIMGYLVSIVSPSLENADQKEGLHTTFYTSPDAPGLGLKLQRASVEHMRKLGCARVNLHAGVRGLGPRMGTIYRRMGAVEDGQSWVLKL